MSTIVKNIHILKDGAWHPIKKVFKDSAWRTMKGIFYEGVWYEIGAFSDITKIKYGFLYNWWATQDQGGGVNIIPAAMASEGWGVPSYENFTTLATYLGGTSVAGGKLKETGLTYWNTPNTGATNEVGFKLRGSGRRQSGSWQDLKKQGYFWTNTHNTATQGISSRIEYNNDDFNIETPLYSDAVSIRPVRPATTAEQLLPDGELIGVFYYGNDGKIYRVTKIGTQVWIADNLAETKWSDGSWIAGYDGGTYTPITDANWAALTTAALCAYDDDESNVLIRPNIN